MSPINVDTHIDKYKVLIEMFKRLSSSCQDTKALQVCIVQSSMSLVSVQAASLVLVDEINDTLHFVAQATYEGASTFDVVVNKRSVAGWSIQNKKTAIINDVKNDARFFDDDTDKINDKIKTATKSVLVVPIMNNGECLGGLELLNKTDKGGFTKDEVQLLELFCSCVGLEVKNAKMLQKAKQNFVYLNDGLKSNVSSKVQDTPFVAKSRVAQDILHIIENVAKTNSCVLLTGEKQTGKELLAVHLHLQSQRKNSPFVKVSCSPLPPSLQDFEIFGCVDKIDGDTKNLQDAYTLDMQKKCALEKANTGTLFLDEVASLSLECQEKLLQVINTKQFQKIGDVAPRTVDVRIVAATSKRLEAKIEDGTFNRDLYYRLNVFPVNVPPLRQRKDDIMALADFFLNKFALQTKKNFLGFSPSAIKTLTLYYWPGNVLELENAIQRACILGGGPYINESDLGIKLDIFAQNTPPETKAKEQVSLQDKSLRSALHRFKKAYILEILKQTRYNQTKAAKILHIQRTYVAKLLNDLDIRGAK